MKCLGCNVLMGAHSTHDKVYIRILSLVDNFFFGWVRTVGIVYGYTVFLDRAKLELQSQTDIPGPRNR